jgi:hypothetical protein
VRVLLLLDGVFLMSLTQILCCLSIVCVCVCVFSRLLKTLSSSFQVDDQWDTTLAAATSTTGAATSIRCLYLCFPSIQLHTLVRQICAGQLQLKGVVEKGTISNRMHLSAFISGGKRRVARADDGVASTIRKANHLLRKSSSNRRRLEQQKENKGKKQTGHGNWIGYVPWSSSSSQ